MEFRQSILQCPRLNQQQNQFYLGKKKKVVIYLVEGFIVDVDGELSFDAIMLDEEQVGSDLITLSDDTVFMTDADVIDMSSMNLDDSDVSFML